MGKKKVRCYTYKLKNNDVIVDNSFLLDVINEVFDRENGKNIKELKNGNLVKIINNENLDNYLSIELIKEVEKQDNNGIIESKSVDDKYLFFRIGREKDIEGAMKRDLTTWEGKEVIEKEDQNSYNLEICTYILIDSENGIILELFGKYAPTVKSLKYMINTLMNDCESLCGITFDYNNIMSNELIDALKENGTRLGQITYNYEIPKLDILIELGLTSEQINAIRELGVYGMEINLKGNGKIPLTRSSDKIKVLLSKFSSAPEAIKKRLSFKGTTNSTSSRNYTFKEEEVTYNIDIPYNRIVDNIKMKLTLEEIAYEVYLRMIKLYDESKNKIKSYI